MPAIAAREFVVPCLEGLGREGGAAGVPGLAAAARAGRRGARCVIERLAAFFAALPRELGRHRPLYALELRNAELLTPRLMRMLARAGRALLRRTARPHARGRAPGDGAPGARRRARRATSVVRWNLHRGFLYQAAKQRYEPFDRAGRRGPREPPDRWPGWPPRPSRPGARCG